MADTEHLRHLLHDIERWEGRTNYLYLDSRGNATIGVGFLVLDAAAACDLPFLVAPIGRLATMPEVASDYARVLAMPVGLPHRAYQAHGADPVLYLENQQIDGIGINRLRFVYLPQLARLFPGFSAFPPAARNALVDMIWNLGLGHPAKGERPAKGLMSFGNLIGACNRGDWETAAQHCHVRTSRETRNLWRKTLFLAAAGSPAPQGDQ